MSLVCHKASYTLYTLQIDKIKKINYHFNGISVKWSHQESDHASEYATVIL